MKRLKLMVWKGEAMFALKILDYFEEGVTCIFDEKFQDILGYFNDDIDVFRAVIDYLSAVFVCSSNRSRDNAIEGLIEAVGVNEFSLPPKDESGETTAEGMAGKIGKLVKVSNDPVFLISEERKLLAVLPDGKSRRYITDNPPPDIGWTSWMYAAPIEEEVLKIDDRERITIYTWEKKTDK